MTDAKSRKRVRAAIQNEVRAAAFRRSSRVTSYYSPAAKKVTKAKETPMEEIRRKAWATPMRTRRVMPPLVRWDVLRPAGCDPHIWLQLFVSDEDIWPDIADEVRYALSTGELERWGHEPEVVISVSCLGLKCETVYEHELTREFRTPECPVCHKPHPFGVNLEYPEGIDAG